MSDHPLKSALMIAAVAGAALLALPASVLASARGAHDQGLGLAQIEFNSISVLFSVLLLAVLLLVAIACLAFNIRERKNAERRWKALRDTLESQVADRTEKLSNALGKLASKRNKYRQMVDHSFDGLVLLQKGKIKYCNSRIAEIVGIPRSDLINRDMIDFIHPDHREIAVRRHERRMRGEEARSRYEIRVLDKDGEPVDCEVSAEVLSFDGQLMDCAYIHDVSGRKAMEKRMARTMAELETIFANSQAGIMVLKGGRYLDKCNQRLADILGWPSPDSMKGISMRRLHTSEENFQDFGKRHFESLKFGRRIHIEYELARQDGTPVWCILSGKALDPGTPADLDKGVVWIVDDISRRKKMEAKLRALATTDHLTKVSTRRHFLVASRREMARRTRYGTPVSLIMVDVDKFKAVNDEHGHYAGDRVLAMFGKLMRALFRKVDVLGRLGGEEFVVLMPETGLAEAIHAANRLRLAVEDTPVELEQGSISFTISAGVVEATGNVDFQTLLKQADSALYEAKKAGRNRIAAPQADNGLHEA